ncbi:MAG: 30S ribosomal protein S3 [Planctomycetes bacterium]|nr:30S ribosomal protein S3 [Planctomycetota bacterium]
MGQKVNPIGLRLGIIENWRSRWYANRKVYGNLLVEDQKIRKFIKKAYHFAGISKIELERVGEKMTVIVHTSSPGLITGRRGAKVDKLTEDIEGLIGRKINLKIIGIEEPERNAQLVAEAICEQLEKRAPHRRTMRKAAETALGKQAKGIRILAAGRIGGAEIARTEELVIGSIPLSTLRAEIDYGFAEAIISKGTIGVKVWIYKGQQLPSKEARAPRPTIAAAAPAGDAPAAPAQAPGVSTATAVTATAPAAPVTPPAPTLPAGE